MQAGCRVRTQTTAQSARQGGTGLFLPFFLVWSVPAIAGRDAPLQSGSWRSCPIGGRAVRYTAGENRFGQRADAQFSLAALLPPRSPLRSDPSTLACANVVCSAVGLARYGPLCDRPPCGLVPTLRETRPNGIVRAPSGFRAVSDALTGVRLPPRHRTELRHVRARRPDTAIAAFGPRRLPAGRSQDESPASPERNRPRPTGARPNILIGSLRECCRRSDPRGGLRQRSERPVRSSGLARLSPRSGPWIRA